MIQNNIETLEYIYRRQPRHPSPWFPQCEFQICSCLQDLCNVIGFSHIRLEWSQTKAERNGVHTQPQFKKLFLLTYKTHSEKQMGECLNNLLISNWHLTTHYLEIINAPTKKFVMYKIAREKDWMPEEKNKFCCTITSEISRLLSAMPFTVSSHTAKNNWFIFIMNPQMTADMFFMSCNNV